MASKKAILKALYNNEITEIFPKTVSDNIYLNGTDGTLTETTLTSKLDEIDGELASKAETSYVNGLKVTIEKISNKEHICIKNGSGTLLSSVDATAFVKDGMLQSAVYDESTHKLTLTWNADSGKTQATVIDLTDLVDAYKGGDGISVTNGTISITSDVAKVGLSTDSSSAVTVLGAKKYAEEKANAAKNAVLGTSSDDYNKNTIYGAKAYAADLVAGLESDLGSLAYKTAVARTDLADAVRTELDSKSRIFYKSSAPATGELVANDLYVQILT